ncbi:MAG: sulfurtransferase TusA family protein [Deltaproteobacteria bacterium]|nr:sulfurtransferase TusA family protein [Deltaproteobacteria bacterium]
MIIPLSLLKITQALRNLKSGETLDIVGTDRDTRKDFTRILETSPHEVLQIQQEKSGYRILLRKGSTLQEV